MESFPILRRTKYLTIGGSLCEFLDDVKLDFLPVSSLWKSKPEQSHNEQVSLREFLLSFRLLELETQLEIAHELGYVDPFTFKRIEAKTAELGRVLNGLIHRFQPQPNRLS